MYLGVHAVQTEEISDFRTAVVPEVDNGDSEVEQLR